MISRSLDDRQRALLDRIHTARPPGRNAEKRFRLFWAQEGRCFWCGEVMTFIYSSGGYIGPEAATLEHLDSRLSPDRGQHPNQRRIVASHMRCNFEYNREDEASVGIAELQRRAGRA
jgi:hypothetical protein